MPKQQSFLSISKESLWKALLSCFLFLLLVIFQDYDFIREEVENTAFDIIYELELAKKDQSVGNKTPVTIFAFDNEYMRKEGLYDDKDNPKYGYIFPRDKIADFLDELDRRITDATTKKVKYCPKAVYIDFDFEFPTAGTSNPLTAADNKLIAQLVKPHCYKILLNRSGVYNFINDSKKPQLRALMDADEPKIIIVSPYLHSNKDAEVRRYKPTVLINHHDESTEYPTAAFALWKIINNKVINTNEIKNTFIDYVDAQRDQSKDKVIPNVNSTNIWLKTYTNEWGNEDIKGNCTRCLSHWQTLMKYSLKHNLTDRDDKLFKDSIIMLGGTYRANPDYSGAGDYHQVLNFMSNSLMSGVDIHANTLMTLLHLNAPLAAVPLWQSLGIIFFTFFIIDFLVSLIFKQFGSRKPELFVTVVLNVIALYFISKYFLLLSTPLWFNWIIPWILIDIVEVANILFNFFHTPEKH